LRRKDDFTCVIFTGLPGSGKTTCGALLGEELNLPFFDTDELIESSECKTIKEIFEQNGESFFRELERDTLRFLDVAFNGAVSANENNESEVGSAAGVAEPVSIKLRRRIAEEGANAIRCNGAIIAVGGGVPEPEMNRELLKRLGTTVYLRAEPLEIASRLPDDGLRPLLSRKVTDEPDGSVRSEAARNAGQASHERNAKGRSHDNSNMVSRLKGLLDRRGQAYESADIKIDTTGLSPHQIVTKLQELLKRELKI
jgi:shikimate kinase